MALLDVKKTKNIAYVILLNSGLYVLSTSGWILTENRNIITIMEILSIWAAVVIVQFFVELYLGSNEDKKSHGMTALVLSACMASITVLNHFVSITVLNQMFSVNPMPSWLMLDGWPSFTKGLECVAWGFFLGLAMVFASRALEDLGSKTITWTMRIGGIMALAGLAGPISGNMDYYLISTIGYSVGFLLLSIEMIVYFNKKRY